jgi:hypothetical protein
MVPLKQWCCEYPIVGLVLGMLISVSGGAALFSECSTTNMILAHE